MGTSERRRKCHWNLSSYDENSVIEGESSDIFVFNLKESGAAGFLWHLDDLRDSGFSIVKDERDLEATVDIPGSEVSRVIAAQNLTSSVGKLQLRHRRPWEDADMFIEELNFLYDLRGREKGKPRAQRPGVAA